MKKYIFLFLLCFSLTGCIATGAHFSGLEEIPQGKSEVYIYRESKMVAAIIASDVIIDGEKKATLKNGGYVKINLTPGTHKIVINKSEGLLGKLSPESGTIVPQKITVNSGERYFFAFKLNSKVMGHTYYVGRNILYSVPEKVAVKILPKLNYSN